MINHYMVVVIFTDKLQIQMGQFYVSEWCFELITFEALIKNVDICFSSILRTYSQTLRNTYSYLHGSFFWCVHVSDVTTSFRKAESQC